MPEADAVRRGSTARSREVVLHVGLREAGGYSLDEVVVILNREQPELRHLPPPPRGLFTKSWIQARMREVRRELEGTGAASY